MNDYLVIVSGGEYTVKATSKEDALTKIHEDERPWVLEVVEL